MTSRPVGLSRDLPPARVMRAEVDGQDVVVWRATDGTLAAWDNKCPHRGMVLSHGFVRGNALACLYHGWHYGAAGKCTYIPAHPDLTPPETIHTRQYAAKETGGVIWVAVEGDAWGPADGLAALRSLDIQASETTVRATSRKTPFRGVLAEPLANDALQFGDLTVILRCNPVSRGTQAIILATPGLDLDCRKQLSRWCEALRRQAEAHVA